MRMSKRLRLSAFVAPSYRRNSSCSTLRSVLASLIKLAPQTMSGGRMSTLVVDRYAPRLHYRLLTLCGPELAQGHRVSRPRGTGSVGRGAQGQ